MTSLSVDLSLEGVPIACVVNHLYVYEGNTEEENNGYVVF
jgi:hypothetical protein